MPLHPYTLHSVIRIIGEQEDPKSRRFVRRPEGTGFYVRVPSETHKDAWYTYVVTAHHVIDGQPKPGLVFPDPYVPGGLYPEQKTENPDWKQPLDDVDIAVLPYARPHNFFVYVLGLEEHIVKAIPGKSLLGMPFHYVGLLEPENRAMARSGTLGALYERGMDHPDGYEYDCHLADCRTYGGFSGSPCFLEITLPELREQSSPVPPEPGIGPLGRLRHLHFVCGMVTWHLDAKQHEEASLYGVVALLPHDYIWKALMAPELVQKRREADALPCEPDAVKVNLSAASIPPSGHDHPSVPDPSEFQNYKNLTPRLAKLSP